MEDFFKLQPRTPQGQIDELMADLPLYVVATHVSQPFPDLRVHAHDCRWQSNQGRFSFIVDNQTAQQVVNGHAQLTSDRLVPALKKILTSISGIARRGFDRRVISTTL